MPQKDTLLKVGDLAPDFHLLDANGQRVKLSDYLKQGKVLLIFLRGTW
jgi:peroxiredoxin